jgi:two-component sensor histidine kinase
MVTSLPVLRIGSLVLPLAGALLWGFWSYIDEKQRAIEQAYENAALVRQYAQRLIETQTILQDAVKVHAAANKDVGYLRTEDFHAFLRGVEASQSFTHGLAVVGLDGQLIASSRSYPVSASFGEREYLTRIGSGTELFLDRILLQPNGQDSLIVAQEFRFDEFRGAIVSAVGIEAIREFLRSIAGREGEAASLLRDDGKLLVRNVPSNPTQLQPSTPAVQAIQAAPKGHYEAIAVSDGRPRLYAYSQLSGLPVFANFGLPTSAIWSQWFWRAIPVWLLLFAGGAFSWTLSGFIRQSFDERLRAEEQVRLRLIAEQKAAHHEQFMRELNHRVKNNLALVDSLIGFQMRQKGGIDGGELRARVRAIAEVHDLLYRATDSYHVDVGALFKQLCSSPALVPQERHISLTCNAPESIVVDAGLATSLALIVVELITNAVKHAFPDRIGGHIEVAVASHGARAELRVADDGIGFPNVPTRSSGTRIVQEFVKQIGGTCDRVSHSGTAYTITFPFQKTEPNATEPPTS